LKVKKGVIKRVVVTPDKHFPLHDQKAINCVKKAIEIVKPDAYVDLGDTGEWELFSNHHWRKYDKPPDDLLIPMLDKSVKQVNKGMDQIDEVLDKVGCKERYFMQGNHEEWLDTYARKHCRPRFLTQNALRLKERGYEFHLYKKKIPLKLGNMNFKHGHRTGMHHAKAHLAMYKESVIYGHTHDLQRHSDTGLSGVISAWSLGCLKDIKYDEEWLRGNLTNWNHAFAIVDIYKNNSTSVQIVEILKGKASLWGEEIDGNK
tara:strand:+ start:86 stop:865 length:780 start_codon:yes stop_codon:yes gene_type:complete